ncbi:MAG: hypothetical protein AABP62_12645 [Planctomycetota bacterium]
MASFISWQRRWVGVLVVLCVSGTLRAQERTPLKVAVFAFVPDASAAIKRLEADFEKAHPSIDLDVELWDPYSDSIDDDGLEQLTEFDVAEIDVCRIDDLIAGVYGGIDEIPDFALPAAGGLLPPARTLRNSNRGRYAVPHLVCGNFLVFRTTDTTLKNAKTFTEILAALDGDGGKPLCVDLWGSTGLGEFYTDAVIDQFGAAEAETHLLAISAQPAGETATLKPEAANAVIRLVGEMSKERREHLSFYHAQSFIYPRDFSNAPHAALLGYSERLYYAEREMQLNPPGLLPSFKQDDLVVRPFTFAETSKGTPTWIDGFVVPRGKLAAKRGAILAFLSFIQSKTGFHAFAQPTITFASSYLLPASTDVLFEARTTQPTLAAYAAVLDDSFPVIDARVWRAMRRAGDALKPQIKAKYPQK